MAAHAIVLEIDGEATRFDRTGAGALVDAVDTLLQVGLHPPADAAFTEHPHACPTCEDPDDDDTADQDELGDEPDDAAALDDGTRPTSTAETTCESR